MTMSLGQIIRRLECCAEDAEVYFDFCSIVPTTLMSYRGYYDQLALGFKLLEKMSDTVKVKDLLKILREGNGKTFEGYKGGDFTMKLTTPVWVDNYGNCTSTSIIGIDNDSEWRIIIETSHIP